MTDDEYISRTLTYLDEKGEVRKVRDEEILTLGRPAVVLGEPGMGKTWLLERLAKKPDTSRRSAATFVEHPDPASLVHANTTLIIDGLDELSATQESDPVYRVLGKLIKAGRPPFVLSCRAADWRGAIARQDIAEEYKVSPIELTLEPLSHSDAVDLLSAELGEKASSIIKVLDEQGASALYGNPLTLKLLSEIGGSDAPPKTKADLFRRACSVMWHEHSDRHDKSSLNLIDQKTALEAAGLVCAGLILTGSEAISFKPSDVGKGGVLSGGVLVGLPGNDYVRAVVRSRLFRRAGDHFKPIHRSLAEYLAARWLALQAVDQLVGNRILAMLTVDGGVPASLRGIHAWLAHFSPQFASPVIALDPYGLLRYGDADELPANLGRELLISLKKLEEENPFFRAEDWSRHPASSITHESLIGDLRSVIFSKDTTFHLRTLLLEAIRGSDMAAKLKGDLINMMMNSDDASFEYGERSDALDALLDIGDVEWPELVAALNTKGDEDSTRLALNILERIGYQKFSGDLVAKAILAHLGLLDGQEEAESRSITGMLYGVGRRLPASQIGEVLDVLAASLPQVGQDGRYRVGSELSSLVSHLIARAIDAGESTPLTLLRWLRIGASHSGSSKKQQDRIVNYLREDDSVRWAIQHHALFVEKFHETVWPRMWRLAELCTGLALSNDDIIHFLNELSAVRSRSDVNVAVWRELSSFVRRGDNRAGDIMAAARPFAAGVPELEKYLDELLQPLPKSEWEIKDEERRRRRDKKRDESIDQARQDFAANEASLRAGELRWIYPVSQAYLGMFNDLDEALSPPERIGQWLGSNIQEAALMGLESVLSRSDLPTLDKVSNSYANGRRWNMVIPLIAAVAERVRTGRTISDLPVDQLIVVRIALHHEATENRINTNEVIERLEAELRQDSTNYERYIRLLIEPALRKGLSHIWGLYGFVRSEPDRALAVQLAREWILGFPQMALEVETELVDLLVDVGSFETLRQASRSRKQRGFVDTKHQFVWLAVDFLSNFDAAVAEGKLGIEDREFVWVLRHQFSGDRHEKRPIPPTTARQLAWIVRTFRGQWPNSERPSGVTSGDTNAWNAAEFLRALINRLAADTSQDATTELASLVEGATDLYTPYLRFAADQQRRARREIAFPGVTIEQLKAVINRQPPASTRDLLTVVRFALQLLQREIRGSDTDIVEKYYNDSGVPRDEDTCTDRLIEDLERLVVPFGIGRTPQRDMPADKRVDIVFTIGDASLPVECKGQWNDDLWHAAESQLDTLYLRDWRTQGYGIYLVYWFGESVPSAKRLRARAGGAERPKSVDELKSMLINTLPKEKRSAIAVEVLDLSR